MKEPDGLFNLIIKKGKTHHHVRFVCGFYIEDGYAIVQRITDKGLSECHYRASELVGGSRTQY